MIFVFKYFHNQVVGGTKRNTWYTNKFTDWDKAERRILQLYAFGITQIKWIQADLG